MTVLTQSRALLSATLLALMAGPVFSASTEDPKAGPSVPKCADDAKGVLTVRVTAGREAAEGAQVLVVDSKTGTLLDRLLADKGGQVTVHRPNQEVALVTSFEGMRSDARVLFLSESCMQPVSVALDFACCICTVEIVSEQPTVDVP